MGELQSDFCKKKTHRILSNLPKHLPYLRFQSTAYGMYGQCQICLWNESYFNINDIVRGVTNINGTVRFVSFEQYAFLWYE